MDSRSGTDHRERLTGENRLRLLSFNIQAGVHTESFRHYITRGWQHLLPHDRRFAHLDRIAEVVSQFDIVALQETDAGSLRSGFVNQVEYLAERAEFPYWYLQRNRDLGLLAQPGNGLLTRVRPALMEDHKLPGRIPGRGAILCRIDCGNQSVCLIVVHLSLGRRDQHMQLAYIRELIQDFSHVVVMGDMNVPLSRLLRKSPLGFTNLRSASAQVLRTYPSWRPFRSLDHVLLTPEIEVNSVETLNYRLSDHLPLAVDISLPA